MRGYLLWAAAMLAIAGCQSSELVNLGDDAELEAYAACNHRQATRFARQSGDPYSLGIAAEASCSREKLALMNIYGKARGPGFAMDLISDLERTAARANAATIARVRAS